MSLDLEFNQPSGKIIQIGMCVGDTASGAVLDTISVIVNPEEELSEFIVKLTGITQLQVNNGVGLYDGYLLLKEFYEKNKPETINPLTWGGGDSTLLRQQLGLEEARFIFGRRWIDVKTVFQAYQMSREAKVQAGLAKALTKVGMQFKGRKHDALDDAINTFRIYCTLLTKFEV